MYDIWIDVGQGWELVEEHPDRRVAIDRCRDVIENELDVRRAGVWNREQLRVEAVALFSRSKKTDRVTRHRGPRRVKPTIPDPTQPALFGGES